MQILRKNQDLNLVLNHETDFQTNLGWQENLAQLEDEILGDIINPTENYETVRFIHEPYDSTNNLSENVVEQTDIWFYFYFLNNGTYNNGLDYNRIGITTRENAKMLRQSTESFFRLEFFKTPHILDEDGNIIGYEAPNRINRKLVFAKNLSLPLGEKVFYTGENFNEYIHVPVFMGSNYKNKENMYFFWFQDESVLTETILSGTTTGNTFFMTAKFFNATDGSIVDFTNDAFSASYTATGITESTDMYYQVDINKIDYSYKVYFFNGTKSVDRYGRTCLPIQFYERGGGTFTKPTYDCTSFVPPPTPNPTLTPTPTPTPTPSPTPAGNGGGGGVTITNCVRLVKNRPMFEPDCSTTKIQKVTVTFYDSTGANVQNAPYDITVTLGGTDGDEPATWNLIIPSGESYVDDYIVVGEQTSGECTSRDGTAVVRTVSGISSISPNNVGECTSTLPPPQGTVLLPFYYGQGRPTSDEHCGINYTINASFFATGTTISGLYGQTIYTTNTGSSAFNGNGLWYPVATQTGTNTEFGQYSVIKINSNGSVQDIRVMGNCGVAVPI